MVKASQVARWVKNPPANAVGTGNTGLLPGSGRSPGEGNGNPLSRRLVGYIKAMGLQSAGYD